MQADGIFMSPPWGGPKYKQRGQYNPLQPFPGLDVGLPGLLDRAKMGLRAVRSGCKSAPLGDGVLTVYLPSTTLHRQIQASIPADAKGYQLLPSRVGSEVKALTLYVWF